MQFSLRNSSHLSVDSYEVSDYRYTIIVKALKCTFEKLN